MKKVKLLLLMVFAIAITFTSCKDDEDAVKPTVTVTAFTDDAMENSADPADYSPGAVIYYKVAATASNNDELKSLTVAFDAQYGTGVLTEDDVKGNTTKDSQFAFTIASSANPNGTTEVTLTFNLEDDDATLAHEVNFTVVAATGQMNSWDDVTLNYNNSDYSNTKSGFDASSKAPEVTGSGTDLTIAYQTDAGYTICSPDGAWVATMYNIYGKGNYPKSGLKTTQILKLASTYDFDGLDATKLSALTVTTGTVTGGGNGVNNLEVNDILAFETAEGLKGVLKVTKAATNKTKNTMTFNVKVQKATGAATK